jgi:hydroxyethylthiazole kinase-like uncharacterized protein yjeF
VSAIHARPILTAAEMRAAEAAAIAAGTAEETLMERAGAAAAEAILRYSGTMPALVLCGPGNNGGDGYVIARRLADRGSAVRVAAAGEPATPVAKAARARWLGPVEEVGEAKPARLMIDALFGTGLARPLSADLAGHLARLAGEARVRVAIDLPSGATTDDGAMLSPAPRYDLTITFQTRKPSHFLQPAARHMGRIVTCGIGVEAESRLHEIARPRLAAPGPDDHKYTRGYVLVFGGTMPGASALVSAAAARAGAGYVRVSLRDALSGVPHAVVQGGEDRWALSDARIGAVATGPGFGLSDEMAGYLNEVIRSNAPAVLDADALTLIADSGVEWLERAGHLPVLTPHEGEFVRLFGTLQGSKVERAREAARRANAVILYKGADTVVAHPDGRAAIAGAASHWLASAGTGDVLTGIVAAMRAKGMEAFEAACSAVWLHRRAGVLAGAGLIADDLLLHLPQALAECA